MNRLRTRALLRLQRVSTIIGPAAQGGSSLSVDQHKRTETDEAGYANASTVEVLEPPFGPYTARNPSGWRTSLRERRWLTRPPVSLLAVRGWSCVSLGRA